MAQSLQDLLNKAKAANAQIDANNTALKTAQAAVTTDTKKLSDAQSALNKANDALTKASQTKSFAELKLKEYCQPYVAGGLNNPFGNLGNYYIYDAAVYTKAPAGHTLTQPADLPSTYQNQYISLKLAYENTKTAYTAAQAAQVKALSTVNTLLHNQSVDQDFVKKTLLAIAAGKSLPVLDKSLYNGNNGGTNWNSDQGGNPPPPVKGDPAPFKYNAPMTSSSYLKFGPQVLSAKNDQLITNPGYWTNAQNAWRPGADGTFSGAKGAIQMSQELASDVSRNTSATKNNKANGLINDTKPYGFKFLYNPTSVGMSWGIVESFSPQFEQSGQDIATAVGNGLLASTVTFSLILNRIEDMQYIKDSSGAFIKDNTTPYPSAVDPVERGLIYDRGTMYDLEYLFRATGGYNSQYKSTVGGITTADKGWLMPMPVELHLGANLRYLVRVSSLEVNHAIFNERMVPIFTTVNLTCTRYYDNISITASNISGATS